MLINNILWNNCNWDSGVEQDIVLNGQWWPSYYQDEMVQATLEADHNLLATSFDGEGNLVGDPQLIVTDGPPVPSADSPAMDSGRAGGFEIWLDGGPFSLQTLLDELSVDFRGQRRSRDGDTMPGIDRGAVERGADE